MSDEQRDLPRHPIRVVAERTGLTPDVLRAWQKRYGLVKPGRSEHGQRLYSDAEVERLRLAAQAVQAGRNPARVAGLSTAELQELVAEDDRARLPSAPRVQHSELVSEAMSAVEQLDGSQLEAVLRRALMLLSISRMLDEVAVPLFYDIGARWSAGELSPAHEHMATATFRRVLEWVMASCEPMADASRVLVATLPGEQHEVGALLAATTAATAGWQVDYLGANLPVDDIAAAAQQLSSDVVAISAVYSDDPAGLERAITELRGLLGSEIDLWLGGNAASSVTVPAGVRPLSSLLELRAQLARGGVNPQPRRRAR